MWMTELFSLFPIPLMRVAKLLDAALIEALTGPLEATERAENFKSKQLSHTEIVTPYSNKSYARIAKTITPKLVEFGEHLFGEALQWSIKEMWMNVLDTGGYQALHAHANSFISGVIYLTGSDASARTTFHKGMGASEFVFSNVNKGSKTGPFNGGKWTLPKAEVGDLILFPSYILHEVPVNQGPRRITLAFNAIPDRLESHGYTIRFAK